MQCPFYGHAANEALRTLAPTLGNQCALITTSHAPCRLEIRGERVDLEACPLNGTQRAIEFATFTRLLFAPTARAADQLPD